ncbi:ABC transporter ATP-binding protein [Massilia sp. W12]|uniref:ABC transporter ATP-binding protein n=1 Tax=Massilia sp. W12 TaxID=3126507 RepID=UPI0030CD3A0E
MSLLQINDLHAWYGKSHVLHGVTLEVGAGEIVSLIGRNGAGRSTLVKALMGLVTRRGQVNWRGQDISAWAPHQIARAGIAYVPESREVFPALTVEQNLLLGEQKRKARAPRWRLDDMYQLFPRLHERRDVAAGVLSGGEQQMLTLCRSLMGDPDLILVDEPTEGLAPKIVEQVANCLAQLRERGVAVLLVEQKLTIALALSQRLYLMGHGEIVFSGAARELMDNPAIRREWLEV